MIDSMYARTCGKTPRSTSDRCRKHRSVKNKQNDHSQYETCRYFIAFVRFDSATPAQEGFSIKENQREGGVTTTGLKASITT